MASPESLGGSAAASGQSQAASASSSLAWSTPASHIQTPPSSSRGLPFSVGHTNSSSSCGRLFSVGHTNSSPSCGALSSTRHTNSSPFRGSSSFAGLATAWHIKSPSSRARGSAKSIPQLDGGGDADSSSDDDEVPDPKDMVHDPEDLAALANSSGRTTTSVDARSAAPADGDAIVGEDGETPSQEVLQASKLSAEFGRASLVTLQADRDRLRELHETLSQWLRTPYLNDRARIALNESVSAVSDDIQTLDDSILAHSITIANFENEALLRDHLQDEQVAATDHSIAQALEGDRKVTDTVTHLNNDDDAGGNLFDEYRQYMFGVDEGTVVDGHDGLSPDGSLEQDEEAQVPDQTEALPAIQANGDIISAEADATRVSASPVAIQQGSKRSRSPEGGDNTASPPAKRARNDSLDAPATRQLLQASNDTAIADQECSQHDGDADDDEEEAELPEDAWESAFDDAAGLASKEDSGTDVDKVDQNGARLKMSTGPIKTTPFVDALLEMGIVGIQDDESNKENELKAHWNDTSEFLDDHEEGDPDQGQCCQGCMDPRPGDVALSLGCTH